MSVRSFVASIVGAWSLACIFAAALFAQPLPPPPAPDAGAPPEMLPEFLRDAVVSPFSGPAVLQAHRLRGLSGQAASLVMLGTTGGSIAIEATAMPIPTGAEKTVVPLFVEIDGSTFLENNQAPVARVEIYAYALDASRRVAGYLAEVFAVDIQELGEAIWQSGLKFHGALELPPGQYTIRVLVRNYQSEANALREVAVEVPADSGALALPLLFPGPQNRDSWLPVRPWNVERLEPYPFVVAEEAISPAARPVLVAGREERAYLFASALTPGPIAGQLELRRGDVVAEQVAFEARADAGAPGLDRAEVRFTLPALDAGTYALTARLTDAAGRAWTLPATEVFVMQQGTQERDLLWTDLRSRVAPLPSTRAPEDPGKKERISASKARKKRIRRLAAGYRAALQQVLAEAESSRRLGPLLDFEANILTDVASGGQAALLAGELALARKLAESDVETLLPLLEIHQELYLTYRGRRLFSLAAHTRAVIERMAELYAKKGRSQGARVEAARVLASLGGHLQAVNLPGSSRQLFQRALELDPRNRAALIALAISYERYGERGLAIEVLETLVAQDPAFGEGLVRLAVNLQRLGQRPRARTLLEQALATQAPTWVHALAYQELARGYLLTGELQRATELLEEALRKAPEQKSSLILLAHAYDRMQAPRRAIDLIQGLGTTQQVSARKSYDGWPDAAFEEVRDQLANAARVRRPGLLVSLDGKAEL